MSEKLNENPAERNDELSPLPAKPDTGEMAEATGAELDDVEGGRAHRYYVDPNYIGGRSSYRW